MASTTDKEKRARRRHNEYCGAALRDPARADELLRPLLEASLRVQLAPEAPIVLEARHTGEALDTGEMDFNIFFRLKHGGFLQLVLEHKSWSDLEAPAQLARYQQLALASPVQDDVRMVAPAVLFHGRGRWTAPFAVEWPEAVGDRYPAGVFCYPLWNLMRPEMQALALSEPVWLAVAAMAGAFRKAQQEARLPPMLPALLRLLDADPLFAKQTMEYISGAWEIEPALLQKRLVELQPTKEGKIMAGMTAWDIEDRGIAKGIAKGRAEGRAEGAAKTLLKQLRVKFKALSADLEARVMAAPPEQLDAWAEAVLTAATLDEALAAKPKP